MRKSELLGLQWGVIDFADKKILLQPDIGVRQDREQQNGRVT